MSLRTLQLTVDDIIDHTSGSLNRLQELENVLCEATFRFVIS